MQFQDVIGQEAVKARMIKSVKEERISHAQLLVGPEGSGKLALALAYAQYICCSNPGEHDSCGVCPSCVKYSKLIHPDLHFVFPVVKTPKAKDPVSDHFINEWRKRVLDDPYFSLDQWFGSIGVDNAQGMIYSHESDEIIRKLNLKTFEAEYKVMIIWLPEKMHVVASNKLLKMIEEPPTKTLFLLISEQEDALISTIKSRVQRIKVGKIGPESLKTALTPKAQDASMDVDSVVHLCNGNYIRAKQLMHPDEAAVYNLEKFMELMRFSYGRKILELFSWVDQVSTIGREKQKSFLQYGIHLVRENFILNIGRPGLNYMNNQEMGFSKRFSPFVNERNIIPISEEFEKAFQHISMNGNPRIIFMDMALKIVKLIRL
ncbi:DNA polymerase III subunit delta [Puteibacter caeruleilacunae]|nr:DNA polymerase III subunit delta [Puteibacter caeruleilacunae]